MSKWIIADCEWIQGHLRYGHYELNLSDSEYEDFIKLSEEGQLAYMKDNADLLVDDYEIDDYAEPSNIQLPCGSM